jgi:hypothetical protein
MPSPGFVVMQANHAVANRTFGIQGVRPPTPEQFYKFGEPYEQTHGRFPWYARVPETTDGNVILCPFCGVSGGKSVEVDKNRSKWINVGPRSARSDSATAFNSVIRVRVALKAFPDQVFIAGLQPIH